MALVIECSSFTATPLGEGRVRLDIQNPERKATSELYEAAQACHRLTELLGRKVTRWNLAYWRDELGLPFNKVGPRKFTYSDKAITDWAHSKSGSTL